MAFMRPTVFRRAEQAQSLKSVCVSIAEVEVPPFQTVEVGMEMLVLCRASRNTAFLRLTKRVRAYAPM
jgi:hypothetical protein